MRKLKVSEYAKEENISEKTARRRISTGAVQSERSESGTVRVLVDDATTPAAPKVREEPVKNNPELTTLQASVDALELKKRELELRKATRELEQELAKFDGGIVGAEEIKALREEQGQLGLEREKLANWAEELARVKMAQEDGQADLEDKNRDLIEAEEKLEADRTDLDMERTAHIERVESWDTGVAERKAEMAAADKRADKLLKILDSVQLDIGNWLEAGSASEKKEYTARVKEWYKEAEAVYGKVVLNRGGGIQRITPKKGVGGNVK